MFMIKINDYSIKKTSSGYEVFCGSLPFIVVSSLRCALFAVIYCSAREDFLL